MDATKPFTIPKQPVMEAFKDSKVTRPVQVCFSKESRSASRVYSFTGAGGWWGRLLDGSGVSREAPAPFCEGLGVQFPQPTHHETFNTLKNQGYHFEHNYGHGQQYLASTLAGLMLLAFLIDQIQEHACRVFQLARARWHSRRTLWERYRALFFTFYIPNWEALMAAWAEPNAVPITLPAPDTS